MDGPLSYLTCWMPDRLLPRPLIGGALKGAGPFQVETEVALKKDIRKDSVQSHYYQVISAVILNLGHAHFDQGHSHLALVSIQVVVLVGQWVGYLVIFQITLACPQMT